MQVTLFNPVSIDILGRKRNLSECASALSLFLKTPEDRYLESLVTSVELLADSVVHLVPPTVPIPVDQQEDEILTAADFLLRSLPYETNLRAGLIRDHLLLERTIKETFENCKGNSTAGYLHNWKKISKKTINTILARTSQIFDDYYQFNRLKSENETPSRLLVSTDPALNQAFLTIPQSISPDTVLLILALSGLAIVFPKIRGVHPTSIAAFRETFGEERRAWIDFFRKFLSDCKERIEAQKYRDAWQYASWVTNQELVAQSNELEAAIRGKGNKQLKDLGIEFCEHIPALIKHTANVEFGSVAEDLMQMLSNVLFKGDDTADFLKKNPHFSFIWQLEKATSE